MFNLSNTLVPDPGLSFWLDDGTLMVFIDADAGTLMVYIDVIFEIFVRVVLASCSISNGCLFETIS